MQELRLSVKPASIIDTMQRLVVALILITMASAPASAKRGRAVPVYTNGGMPNVQAQGAVAFDLTTGEYSLSYQFSG